MAAIFYYIRRFPFKLYKNKYEGVFEVADYDSNVACTRYFMNIYLMLNSVYLLWIKIFF